MKLKLLVFPVLLTALVSCVREAPVTPEREPEAGQVTESEQAPSYVKVLFSEEMCGLVEEDLSRGQVRTRSEGLNGLVDELGIESMERLFPFAGEFEPRTRKEGLHRWYKVSYAEGVPATRATRAFESLPGVELVEEPLKAWGSTTPGIPARTSTSRKSGRTIRSAIRTWSSPSSTAAST